MRSKLTLRLDDELIREAKALAEQRGTSLSQLVASYFRALTRRPSEAPREEPLPPLTRALVGVLRDEEIREEGYRAHLERKHR
jgi:hypothetical protein